MFPPPTAKDGEEPLLNADQLRAKILQFLHARLPALAPTLLHTRPDLEELVRAQIRAVLGGAAPAEFQMLFDLLLCLKRSAVGGGWAGSVGWVCSLYARPAVPSRQVAEYLVGKPQSLVTAVCT